MPAAVFNRISDSRAAARKRREAKRARLQPARRRRRRIVAKVVVCASALALFALLAYVVGDGDFHATAIGWVPLLTMAFAIILAFAYLQVLKRSLSFSDAGITSECERGQDVRFTVRFANTSVLYFFKIEAFFYVSDLFGGVDSEDSITLALAPRETTETSFRAVFEHVGTYAAGIDRVVIADFLGLFTAVLPNKTRHEVKVLPRIYALDSVRFANDAIVETTKAARSVLADSMDYAYVRDYELGDPLKAIHWKLSARANHYLTRLYEIQTNPGLVVVLDFYGPHDDAQVLMGMYDAVVESGLSIACYARQKGMDVDLVFKSRDSSTRRVALIRQSEISQLIDDMPRMSNSADEASAAASLLRDEVMSPTGQSNVVMCSASMDSSMLSVLVEAKTRRRAPLLVSVVPRGIVERELDAYCRPLARLDQASVPYIVLSDAASLAGVTA